MNCGKCFYYKKGECHLNPPVPVQRTRATQREVYKQGPTGAELAYEPDGGFSSWVENQRPKMEEHDFCGQFKEGQS